MLGVREQLKARPVTINIGISQFWISPVTCSLERSELLVLQNVQNYLQCQIGTIGPRYIVYA